MDWKISRDNYYSELYDKFGLEFIKTAGFLFDTLKYPINVKNTVDILCTHIPDCINIQNPVILLTTGAFCPFHDGHIDMMINAKKEVEKLGKTVVAGYISPSHDEYVLSKIPGGYNANERIKVIERQIKNYNWLFVDPWESIFCECALNFTDVIERLDAYIFNYTKKHIPIYFVCGSDNARFALTFGFKGNCIVVNRPGFDPIHIKNDNLIKHNDRILWAEGNNKYSSTLIRSHGLIPFEKPDVYIRKECIHLYEDKLIELLTPYFKSVTISNYVSQLQDYKTITKNIDIPIVSLDSLIDGDVNFKVSRLFNLFGTRKLGYIQTPPSKDISGQTCFLFDDDICSGGTIDYATNELNKLNVKVAGVFTFKVNHNGEVLDCRDFLIGHPSGGLMIQLPNGNISRVPYIYPFVCPFLRASINDPMKFSIDVWKLNYEYFKNNEKTVEQMPNLKSVLLTANFKLSDCMSDVCLFYINFLTRFLGYIK